MAADEAPGSATAPRIGLPVIAREWGRIGVTGFGGPPAHIALLRRLCVQRNSWLSEAEFEDGIAATSLLPGPASTQLAIFCAWRLAGTLGAIVGGVAFIVPGMIIILGLSALFLAHSPPAWVTGLAAGAGAAVPAVAVSAAVGLMPASWRRASSATSRAGHAAGGSVTVAGGSGKAVAGSGQPVAGSGHAAGRSGHAAGRSGHAGPLTFAQARWIAYLLAGGVAANLAGQFLVAVLLACGLLELLTSRLGTARSTDRAAGTRDRADGTEDRADGTEDRTDGTEDRTDGNKRGRGALLLPLAAKAVTAGVLGSIAWVAIKVGALSFGGGFVIIPLMQHDAVHTYHWMTSAQFLSAVALGQVTPGPVVQTVSVVGYAAAGLAGGVLAGVIAFTPSFVFVLAGGPHFDRFRRSAVAQTFLSGAGPAAIGAIAGAAVILGLGLTQLWQVAVLAAAGLWLVALRRGVVSAILLSAGIGVIVALAGGLS
jgi:chromate transporter